MCLLIHFVLKMFMYLLKTANIMFLSFIRFELLSFEHGKPNITHNVNYNFVALLLGCNQVFFHPGVLDFLPICFQLILFVSGKPHLFSWGRLDSSVFVCTSYGQKSRVEVSSCSCHLK